MASSGASSVRISTGRSASSPRRCSTNAGSGVSGRSRTSSTAVAVDGMTFTFSPALTTVMAAVSRRTGARLSSRARRPSSAHDVPGQ